MVPQEQPSDIMSRPEISAKETSMYLQQLDRFEHSNGHGMAIPFDIAYGYAPSLMPNLYGHMPQRGKKKDGMRKGKWTVCS